MNTSISNVFPHPRKVEDPSVDVSIEALKQALVDNLFYLQGKFSTVATPYDFYMALAYTVREHLLYQWLNTAESYFREQVRVVCYFSPEYLLGRHLANNLINLELYEPVREAIEACGLSFEGILEQETEAGLGYGKLGQLAACYLESLATLNVPAIAYGIRYEYGMFDQKILEGWQVEITDKWLRYGNPWEIARPEAAVEVKLGGHTEAYYDETGRYRVRWIPAHLIRGVPYDTPIVGYQTKHTNTLRLWKSEAPESLNFQSLNIGDYYGAVHERTWVENLTKVFYPKDEPLQGKTLRLEQYYFFISCSLQDMIRIHLTHEQSLETFDQKFTVQLNETYSAISIAELMRLFVDEYGLEWELAWSLTRRTFTYTNHTVTLESSEKWSVGLLGSVLPRHLEIIYEINNRFLIEVRGNYPGDHLKLSQFSLIDETGERYIRMAHLVSIGSSSINGVSAVDKNVLKSEIIEEFYQLWPHKFRMIRDGISPRRWLVLPNTRLTHLISDKIGKDWIKNLDKLQYLEGLIDDGIFKESWRQVKWENKQALADYIEQELGISVNPNSLFDIQLKPIHEYKRQHLNILHIITLYNKLRKNPNLNITPRTFIFAGKAAPSYFMAKLMIKLIHSVANVVNTDANLSDRLKVVFLPNYNVTLGQRIYPAADLAEQISTVGKEPSAIGNLKFALNGALTIGTLEGTNLEIQNTVGSDNFFSFGLTLEEVVQLKNQGYNPWSYYHTHETLREVIDQISSGYFSQGDPNLFKPLVDALLYHDEYLLLADYQSYTACQEQISQVYRDYESWTRMSILNVARIGKFSSDYTVEQYCQNLWNMKPISGDG